MKSGNSKVYRTVMDLKSIIQIVNQRPQKNREKVEWMGKKNPYSSMICATNISLISRIELRRASTEVWWPFEKVLVKVQGFCLLWSALTAPR